MAFGFPRSEQSGPGAGPLVWDQASSAMARGEIQLHQRDGKDLPEGVGIDTDGNPTTSPDETLAGAQLPFGGHKGAAIAMMVELLAAGLTGSQLSFESHDADPTWNGPSRHGELLILIDPKIVSGDDSYLQHSEMLFERILTEEGTRLPSARRYANRLRTPAEGVFLPKALYDEIVALGQPAAAEGGGGGGATL